MDSNPYAAPLATGAPPPPLLPDSDVRESVRREHIGHEASVRSIGTLYILGFIFLVIGGAAQLVAAISLSKTSGATTEWAVTAGLFALAILQIWLGLGLRKLQRSARIVATIFAAIGLAGIPIGTIISAYILYLLWSRKGAVVFSPEYQEIIAATPHIRYKTSKVVWILLGIVLFIIVAIVVLAFFSSATR